MSDKSSLRQKLKARRQALSKAELATAATKVGEQLFNHCQAMPAQHVGGYLAFQGEVSLAQFFDLAFAAGINCYLPRVVEQQQLVFHQYHAIDTLVKNRYGILEPQPSTPVAAVQDLDVLVMPLVAVTATGDRLGMGAGYYDRMLGQLRAEDLRLPQLVGVAYDFQLVPEIATDQHDVRLDCIITPSQVINVSTD